MQPLGATDAVRQVAFGAVIFVLINVGIAAQRIAPSFVAHFVEGCSCSVPCACNFGGIASPSRVCQSLAVFYLEAGDRQTRHLVGRRLGIESRAGEQGIIIVEPSAPEEVRARLEELGALILGQDGTYRHNTVRATISMSINGKGFDALIPEHGELRANYLTGSLPTHRIKVINPIVFGDLPVAFVYKAATELISKDLKFRFKGTNANEGYVRLDKLLVRSRRMSPHLCGSSWQNQQAQ